MTGRQQQSLNKILEVLGEAPLSQDIMVSGLALDSRKLVGGELFLAVPGFHVDGRDYIHDAMGKGVAAILAESGRELSDDLAGSSDGDAVPVISIDNLQGRIGFLASHYYRQPSEKLRLTGVTGTNGKTSCCWFIAQLLSRLGQPCAVMGTIGKGIPPELEPCLNTTSDSISLQQYIAALVEDRVPAMAMEVSSHGLDQRRTDGLKFEVAVFTNISRDHLDYHRTIDAYARTKAQLFARGQARQAVINLDDEYSDLMLSACPAGTSVVTFSTRSEKADIFASDVHLSPTGLTAYLHTPWGDGRLETPLMGRFNLENLLAVIGAVCVQGFPLDSVLKLIPDLASVPGRMQSLGGIDKPLVIVDYAHTPDALASVLVSLREHGADSLTCVFGCGGDRDKGKRPQMTKAAISYADRVVVTSDNPRTEDPEVIIADALKGIPSPDRSKVNIVVDRAEAISRTVERAEAGDIVVVAGKGHEDYQEVNGKRLPFDDAEHVKAALSHWGMGSTHQAAVRGVQ
ncbi:MAG: UDP-N-acetylmuramoyl-L-alanyl-D-glutamate--2,6-diaminopimelate ligase [Endozoicomonas sp.]